MDLNLVSVITALDSNRDMTTTLRASLGTSLHINVSESLLYGFDKREQVSDLKDMVDCCFF